MSGSRWTVKSSASVRVVAPNSEKEGYVREMFSNDDCLRGRNGAWDCGVDME